MWEAGGSLIKVAEEDQMKNELLILPNVYNHHVKA